MLLRGLLACDDDSLRLRVRGALQRRSDLETRIIRSRRALWRRLSRESVDLVILDRDLIEDPPDETIRAIRSLPGAPEVVLLTGRSSHEDNIKMMASGASLVLHSSLEPQLMDDALHGLVEARGASRAPMVATAERVPRLNDFISDSPAMQVFLRLVRRVAASDSSLLILGETGVGKEHLARAVHEDSTRAGQTFVAVNCAAIPETLLESEMFGHEEGAFTGASRSRRGAFELAHGGTLFLDEICEMPVHVQAKLLSVLQGREIQRLGSETTSAVDVRVMAATNRDVHREMEEGRFRQDLYYRLSVVTLTVPPLRERTEDIEALCEDLLERLKTRVNAPVDGIEPAAVEALRRYSWPGNVRELANVLERAMLLASTETIRPIDLPDSITGRSGSVLVPEVGGLGTTNRPAREPDDAWLELPIREVRRRVVAEAETRYLSALLARTGGRIGDTARLAGLKPRALHGKMKRYGLRKQDFKKGAARTGEAG